jgi:NitT/TauT family transport system substrate-binding protein
MPLVQPRRRFLANVVLAGAAGFGGLGAASLGRGGKSLAAEPPPETTTIRFDKAAGICIAPLYAAAELLRAEGFTDVRYVTTETGREGRNIENGEVDFAVHFAGPFIMTMDSGGPIKVLAGLHSGCFELFGNESIRSIADLKGRTAGVPYFGSGPHVFLASMGSYVGLDPAKDIRWVTSKSVKPMELFAQGKIDAFLGFPPDPQELRSKNIGQVIVNSSADRPWSQAFCCVLAGNADFARKFPVATKRVVRAILKATDLCASEPTRVAQLMVDGGFTPSFALALQTLHEVPYGVWREYDPEDTIRFYALRLQEAGMIRSSPHKIISEHTDWRFLNELKRELKV